MIPPTHPSLECKSYCTPNLSSWQRRNHMWDRNALVSGLRATFSTPPIHMQSLAHVTLILRSGSGRKTRKGTVHVEERALCSSYGDQRGESVFELFLSQSHFRTLPSRILSSTGTDADNKGCLYLNMRGPCTRQLN